MTLCDCAPVAGNSLQTPREIGASILENRGFCLACLVSISLECNTRSSAGAVAERVSALARRNLLRTTGRDINGEECAGVFMGYTVGIAQLPGLDKRDRARRTQTPVGDFIQNREPDQIHIIRVGAFPG